MVDFGKHTKKRSGERQTNPIELYERLDRLSDTGPLRPAQENVLNEWHKNRRGDHDLIVKLHTGQGKTIVGLLMLLSRLNEGIGPALYLCPNKYLVDQTCLQAQRFGITVINGNEEGDLPPAFLNGQKIYVCTIQKLFNGLTKFGLKAESTLLGTVLMDDCHACIDSIKQSCSINIKRGSSNLYDELLQLFSDDLQEQGAGTFAEIYDGEYNAFLPVPYWVWIDRHEEVTKIVGKYRHDRAIQFVWPILKDMLDKCCCVISGSGLEISPHVPPLSQFGSFHKAKHRIFMSATITDDSFLVKGLRLKSSTITKPLTYPKEKWFGEKMILIPSLIDSECGRESVVKGFAMLGENNKTFGTIGLCPSTEASKLWQEAGADVVETSSIKDHVQRLLEGKFDKSVCFVNRYDGIDLPDKSCRILVLDSKPFSGGLIDRYTESCRLESEVTAQRIARMIEQGLGRGVRGEKDYCAVILVGGDLVRAVQRSDVKKFYSSQTRQQIEIGIDIVGMSENEIQHGVSGIEIVFGCVNKLLMRDEGWKEFYVERMDDVMLDQPNQDMLKLYEAELDAETKAEDGHFTDASNLIQEMMDSNLDLPSEDRGWYLQERARLIYRHSKIESATLQTSAHKKNGYVLKPKNGLVITKLEPLSQKRVLNVIDWVRTSKDNNDLIIRVNAILDDLRFGVSSDKFEYAFNELGKALGFASERPDKVWGKGPDNLWCLKTNQYLLVEAKNEVKIDRHEISKTETGQINNSYAWFTKNYPGAKVECVMVISSTKVSDAGGFNMPVTVMDVSKLKSLTKSVRNFFKEFSAIALNDIDPNMVGQRLQQHSLETDSLVQNFTKQVKN